MTDAEVRDLIQYACDCNGCPELARTIDVKWSNRMTRSMGNARIRGVIRRITLSVPLMGRADEYEQWDTVVHEACHIIDAYVNGRRMSHGPTWEECMRRAGCKAEQFHSVSTAGLQREFVYKCDCNEHRISVRQHNFSVRTGRHRVCRSCRSRLEWTGRVEGGVNSVAAQAARP